MRIWKQLTSIERLEYLNRRLYCLGEMIVGILETWACPDAPEFVS